MRIADCEIDFARFENHKAALEEEIEVSMSAAIANTVFTTAGEAIRTMPMTKQGFSYA